MYNYHTQKIEGQAVVQPTGQAVGQAAGQGLSAVQYLGVVKQIPIKVNPKVIPNAIPNVVAKPLMPKPFNDILVAGLYNLKYYGVGPNNYRYNQSDETLENCIYDTYLQYGYNIDIKDFKTMIAKLTSGGTRSVLACKSRPGIINVLCKYYPILMNNKKMIDNFIKCMNPQQYPQYCIDYISNTGYKFTKSQISTLNAIGYIMMDHADNLSYEEFLSQYDNINYIKSVEDFIDTDIDYLFKDNTDDISGNILNIMSELNTKNTSNTNAIISLRKYIDNAKEQLKKFKLEIDEKFIIKLAEKVCTYNGGKQNYTKRMYNIHIIAYVLGYRKYSADTLQLLINKHECFYLISERYLRSENQAEHNTEYDRTLLIEVKKQKKQINHIVKFYNNPLTRDFILDCVHKRGFVIAFINNINTSYDPVEDIFYILTRTCDRTSYRYDRTLLIKHLLNEGYLIYDEFLLLLISFGLVDGNLMLHFDKQMLQSIECKYYENFLINCVKNENVSLTKKLIKNIFTFCSSAYILSLAELKIITSLNLIKNNISYRDIKTIVNESIFIDDKTYEYYDKLSFYDTTAFENNYKNESMTKRLLLEGYKSLSDRDKNILIRINCDENLLSNIIRYRMKLTKEFVLYLAIAQWRIVVFLLHLSKNYNYIIKFIDDYMITLIPSYIGRSWFYNNFIENQNTTFALKNVFFDKFNRYSDSDYNELLKKPVLIIMSDIEKELESDSQEIQNGILRKIKISRSKQDSDTNTVNTVNNIYDNINNIINNNINNNINNVNNVNNVNKYIKQPIIHSESEDSEYDTDATDDMDSSCD